MGKVLVITLGLAVRCLVFGSEVAAARFIALEGVKAHEFTELEEIGHATGAFEGHVERFIFAQHSGCFPKLALELWDAVEGALEAGFASSHPAVVPHDETKFAVKRLHGAASLDGQEAFNPIPHFVLCLLERRMLGGWALSVVRSKVVTDGGGDDEVTVRETLHQRTGAEAVGAVIGEVGFAENEEAGDVGHQVVVHPETAHRVVHRWVDSHRSFVGIFPSNLVVHVEQIAVPLANLVLAEALDGVSEIEVNAETAWADTSSVVARFFRRTRRDVARGEIPEARILAFEIVIPFVFRDLVGRTVVAFLFRYPDTSVVSERFAHEGEL